MINEQRTMYVGIDPGKTGFITVLIENEYYFYPMCYKKVATGEFTKTGKMKEKTVFDEAETAKLAVNIYAKMNEIYWDVDLNAKVIIEEVGGRGGWSATNNFNFGYVAGLVRSSFYQIPGVEIITVRPQKWQAHMRRGHNIIKKASSTGKTQVVDAKAIAEQIVTKDYPNIDFRKSERANKVDHNKIDSFLLCRYLVETS